MALCAVFVYVTAVETYPLYLGSVCGQSRSERSNAVFGVIKPAEILQENRDNRFPLAKLNSF